MMKQNKRESDIRAEPAAAAKENTETPPTLGSLFDGIGGFPLAGVHNGMAPVWASEIEPFPIEVTKVRFPQMRHVGDITRLNGAVLPPVEVICGGSPCQDLSVAGARAGLAGARSGLFMEQVRLVKEMRDADAKRGRTDELIRPRYMVWENVPGAYSSAEGEDFRAVLEEIVRVKHSTADVPRPDTGAWQPAGAILLGDQFSLAWRTLDAQYWGVAQRRRRIFLVADFAGLSAPEILFKQDSLLGNPAPSGGTRQGTAAPAAAGVGDSGGDDRDGLTPWDVQSRHVYTDAGTWPSLYGGEGGGHGYVSTEEKSKLNASPLAFAANQRDEVRELHGISAALQAQPGMKQQTFVADADAIRAFHVNQRDEVIDLHGLSGALMATCNIQMQTFITESGTLNQWDHQPNRITLSNGVVPTLAGADGGGGRNPGGLIMATGVVSKGNGDCFLTPETHTSLTMGGGQAGQGYPCVMTAGFCAGAAPSAGEIGYTEEVSPTLKAAESGTNMVPSILCLNDQGGQRMDVYENATGTLRANAKGHEPMVFDNHGQDSRYTGPVTKTQTISAGFGMGGTNTPLVTYQPQVYENHGIDARYTGPHDIAPTMSARYGTGGNNVPLVGMEDTFCISGNTIDRQPQNGGNGFGYQSDLSYTITTCDRHAVFSRQRSDEFAENVVTATQSARQHKDATDLICQPYQQTVGTIGYTDHKGINNQFVSEDKCIVERRNLIRRLTPLECERLQGFPDGWTDIPDASDSARYKALGNSVAIPCVDFVLRGIAFCLRKMKED